MNNILIIGYGKLGSHLFFALTQSPKANVVEVIKNANQSNYFGLVRKANVIFICVQDTKIKNVVKKLSGKSAALKNKFVFHTSGSLSSAELKPLRARGAFTGSFHPVQTFGSKAKNYEDRFKGIYTAIEGDHRSRKKAAELARILRSNSFEIEKDSKVFHHLCCVIASNFISTLARQVEKIGSKKIRINGFNKLSFFNIYTPLAAATLDNIAKNGAVNSLSGPVERSDTETIIKHMDALKAHPTDVLPIYLLLGIETVKLALEKKSITLPKAKNIIKIFAKYIKNNKIK
jgi:predicted short-subunit dehydrogenase-like oxidoreductase (DUF2520 family)